MYVIFIVLFIALCMSCQPCMHVLVSLSIANYCYNGLVLSSEFLFPYCDKFQQFFGFFSDFIHPDFNCMNSLSLYIYLSLVICRYLCFSDVIYIATMLIVCM